MYAKLRWYCLLPKQVSGTWVKLYLFHTNATRVILYTPDIVILSITEHNNRFDEV